MEASSVYFFHGIQNPRSFRGTKETTLASFHLFWHDPWAPPQRGIGGPQGMWAAPHLWGHTRTFSTAPHTGAPSASLGCPSAAETHFRGRNRIHLLDNVSSQLPVAPRGMLVFVPFFPRFLPSITICSFLFHSDPKNTDQLSTVYKTFG